MNKNLEGKVLNIEKAGIDTVKLQFSTPLNEIIPGQFVSILIPDKTLRRPFSVAGFRKENGQGVITIIFKIKGDGTNWLNTLKAGDCIDYLAPLGNGFHILENGRALLVGAGVGIAPMLYLKQVLAEKNIQNYLISGFKTEEEVVNGSDLNVIGGSVLDNLQNLIDVYKPEIMYSCGPSVVLKRVCELAYDNKIKAQIAMEKVMACGIGVCRGCAIKIQKDGDVQNASVCKDGPVFEGAEVIWEQ